MITVVHFSPNRQRCYCPSSIPVFSGCGGSTIAHTPCRYCALVWMNCFMLGAVKREGGYDYYFLNRRHRKSSCEQEEVADACRRGEDRSLPRTIALKGDKEIPGMTLSRLQPHQTNRFHEQLDRLPAIWISVFFLGSLCTAVTSFGALGYTSLFLFGCVEVHK